MLLGRNPVTYMLPLMFRSDLLFFDFSSIQLFILIRRRMAQPKRFMTAVATRLGSCFRKCNLRKVKSFYELRLRTWSANYARQSELLCDAFTDYHTDETNTIAPVVDGVRLCKDCHIAVLGINKKRYNSIHRQWVQSGKNLKHRESLHGN